MTVTYISILQEKGRANRGHLFDKHSHGLVDANAGALKGDDGEITKPPVGCVVSCRVEGG